MTIITPHLLRVSSGLLAAFGVAALLKLALFDLGANATSDASVLSLLFSSIGYVLGYGLLAIPVVVAAEVFRVRHAAVYFALGTLLTFAAAHFSTRGEALTSPVFSSGMLTGLFLLAIGILSSLAYWIAAGRRAGWRGDDAERSHAMAAEAFRTASANAQVEYCRECLLGWSAAGAVLFLLFGWISIDTTGLRDWFIAEAHVQGKSVLRNGGHAWATFKIDGDRGVIEGVAPDEVQRRAAFDSVRDALDSVTGFPGILASIENQAVARTPVALVSQQLADAARREDEAKAAVEAAKVATEAARAAEGAANRKAEEQARAAEVEMQRRLDEQARAAEDEARRQAAAPAAAPAVPAVEVEVAAADTGAPADAKPQVGNDESAGSPALDDTLQPGSSCTAQDLAIIESSSILFEMQRFEIAPGFDGELDRLAASARACAPQPILVSGHADANADSLFNPALGLQRAHAVREGLIARGVPSTLVVARFAATNPIDDASSSEDRALGRKTEFRFLEASEITRDATLGPDERATTCESDLSDIMAQSIIHFPMASSRVSENSTGLIKKLAGSIQTCGSVIVTVEGHTDKIGAPGYNQGLSEARANAVREALVAAGADPTRLASHGFASSRPYDAADTVEAFALNRRIEFRVSGKFTSANTGGP